MLALCVALMAQISGEASAQDLGVRRIHVDYKDVKGPLNRMAEMCVGAGRANEGLRADWQQQLAHVHQDCGFKYIRMHGIFCDDMGVYQEDRQGRPEYNWQYVDKLYDFLVGIGMKPFVELGFMPGAMASGSQTIFWWRGNTTLPRDFSRWGALVEAFTRHLTERYGEEEVAGWYFEVWNEPNLEGFFKGTQQDYFHLYEVTAKAVKSVCPQYRVGGPATAGCGWIGDFIQFCATNPAPVDFISTHTYGVDAGFLDENGNHGTMLSTRSDSIYGEMQETRRVIQNSLKPGLPLHFTEWSSSYTPSDPFHDSYQSAAYILDKIKNADGCVQSMSYWTFTDIFEEAGPRFTPFHGGFGLLNEEGIQKPSYFAYHFLHSLGDVQLTCEDRQTLACRDARGGMQILVWDEPPPDPSPRENNQTYYSRIHPSQWEEYAQLQLVGVPAGTYLMKVYRVGYRSNDAYTAYLDMGAPPQFTRSQETRLKAASDGKAEEERSVVVADIGECNQRIKMRKCDVVLVTLEKP